MKVSKERIDAVEVFCSPDSSSLSPSGSSNGPSSQSDCRRLHINWSSCQTVSTSSGSTASPEQKQLDVPIKAAIFTPPVYLTRKPDLFIYSHCRVTPGTRANGLKKHPKLQRHEDTILLLYPVKKRCPYLLSDFISFAGSKCSVILSSPAHQMTKTSDQTFNRLIKSAFEVLALVLMSSCEEFFSRFFFYKSLTGFVSWGNQITGVIIVCTSQQLLWFPSVCTVQPQAVEAVSFTRGTTHKHEVCGELWRSSGDGWEAAEVSAVQNIYLRVKLEKKEKKIVPHKHLGVFCDFLPNLPVKCWYFFNLSELKDIFTTLWKGVQLTISRSVSHISDSVQVRFTHMHRLKQYIDSKTPGYTTNMFIRGKS